VATRSHVQRPSSGATASWTSLAEPVGLGHCCRAACGGGERGGERGGSGAACGGGKQSIACGAVTARDACNVDLGYVSHGYGGACGTSFGLTGA